MARDWTVRLSPRGGWRYGAALGLVGASTAVAEVIYRLFDTDRLSMVFLAGVLVACCVPLAWSPDAGRAATCSTDCRTRTSGCCWT